MSPVAPRPSPTSFQLLEQPAVETFADGEHFMLIRPLVVWFGEGADSLVVPAGFVSDLASIPRVAQSLIPKLGPYNRAAIVHDYLYWTQCCSRREADVIFLKMMKDLGVSFFTRKALFFSVANFGRGAWYENARQRGAGLPRVAPPGARRIGPYETWSEYRVYLRSLGEGFSTEPVLSPGFCTCPKAARRPRSARAG
jgi:hypothetical protein